LKVNGGKYPRIKVDSNDIYVYDNKVHIKEIVPLMIKKKRCEKQIPNMEISWTVLTNKIKDRSYDDIRNYWLY
jgi:hypothetical protein